MMRNARFLTCMMIGLAMLAGTAYAASADDFDVAFDVDETQLDLVTVAFQPGSGDPTLMGKGKPPNNPPTPTPTPVPCSGCPEMHVDFLVVSYGSTQDTYGLCRASIVDAAGDPVDGVHVTFETSDPFAGRNTVTQTLGENYDVAWLEQRRPERYSCGKRGIPETMTCTIVGVYHPDYSYTPALNVETSDSESCSN